MPKFGSVSFQKSGKKICPMTDSIDIISYTDYRGVHKKGSNPELKLTKRNVTEQASTTMLAPKQTCVFSFIKLPAFLERPFNQEVTIVSRRFSYLKSNLARDFFVGHTFVYPFTGLFELVTHKVYWGPLMIFAACYLSIFVVVAVIYYIVVIPLVIAWALITLGPLGILLGHIQWILQTNAITTMICRNIVLSHMDNQIFDVTLYLSGQRDFLTRAKFIKVTNKQQKTWEKFRESWQFNFPLMLVHWIRKCFIIFILAMLSMVPIFGPPLTNQLVSGRRGFSYMSRYFTLKGVSAAEAKDFQYEHLGLFFSFGMAAGLLEFVPLFSIITILSNTIGAAKWSVDLIKKSQVQ